MIKHLIGGLLTSALLVGSTPAIADPPPDIAIVGCAAQSGACDPQTHQCIVEYQVIFPQSDVGQACESNLEAYVRNGFEIFSIDPNGAVFLWANDANITAYHMRRDRGGAD